MNTFISHRLCILFLLVFGWSGVSFNDLPVDTVIDVGSLPLHSNEEIERFAFVKDKMEGLSVLDPSNESIGYPRTNKLKPVNGKKMILCGKLNQFFIYDGSGDEYDWNLVITPTDDFKYIIDRVIPLVHDRSEWKRCNTNNCLEAEITPDESLYNNIWFPNHVLRQRQGFSSYLL